jgi:hypothetical protein
MIIRGWISKSTGKSLHFLNLASILVFPVYIINTKYESIGPGENQ